MAIAQALFAQPVTPGEQAPLVWFAGRLGVNDPVMSLPAPTVAQVSHWGELCGALNDAGPHGIADDAWRADLAPSRPTLRALEERRVLVRRDRAWHLCVDWYTRMSALRLRATPTPPLELMDAPGEGLPTYRELEAIEGICRWLDAQPRRRSRLPFTGCVAAGVGLRSETPVPLLHLMHKHKLVQHRSGCEWALALAWKERLLALWHGLQVQQREMTPAQLVRDQQARVVASGIDTWYLNWLTDEALPPALERWLDDLQAEARENETEWETPWRFDGSPLLMYQHGVSAKGKKGVSWAFILRNPSLTLKIRRTPLGSIIAQARLGSECLWRLTPLRALNELHESLRRMWGRVHGRLQVSEIHLAVDLVNLPLNEEMLSRFVSRSRNKARYEAAQKDLVKLQRSLRKPGIDGVDDFDEFDEMASLGVDWDAEFGADDGDLFGLDPFADGADDENAEPVNAVDAALEEAVADRSRTVYQYGLRYSGASWSLGSPLSVVLYDKTLQARLTNKRHMESIWEANGWDVSERVTRCEVRAGRPIIHDLRLPDTSDGVTPEAQLSGASPFDDPYFCLDHLPDLLAMAVGQPQEDCPDAVNVAWLRLVTPLEGDKNRSRWPTDPAWTVLQRASFTPAPVQARRLIRRRQTSASVTVLDRLAYGALVSRVAMLHPHGGQYDISAAIGEIAPALIWESEDPKKDFGELVRERRRRFGKPLPPAERVLPFRSAFARSREETKGKTEEETDSAPALDVAPADNASDQERARWRLALAERRLREAEQAYETALRHHKPMRVLTQLRAAVDQEAATCAAVGAQAGPGEA
jgi:hypothetical protein